MTTIRIPAEINFSSERINVGDTSEFIAKFGRTQEKIEQFGQGLSVMASDLQQVASAADQAIGAAEAAAVDLQEVRDLMEVNLSPAVAAALARINEAQPITEADLHARALYF